MQLIFALPLKADVNANIEPQQKAATNCLNSTASTMPSQ
jgi:hypothetical protein